MMFTADCGEAGGTAALALLGQQPRPARAGMGQLRPHAVPAHQHVPRPALALARLHQTIIAHYNHNPETGVCHGTTQLQINAFIPRCPGLPGTGTGAVDVLPGCGAAY